MCNLIPAAALHSISLGRVLLVVGAFALLLLVADLGATRRRNNEAIERMRAQRGPRL